MEALVGYSSIIADRIGIRYGLTPDKLIGFIEHYESALERRKLSTCAFSEVGYCEPNGESSLLREEIRKEGGPEALQPLSPTVPQEEPREAAGGLENVPDGPEPQ